MLHTSPGPVLFFMFSVLRFFLSSLLLVKLFTLNLLFLCGPPSSPLPTCPKILQVYHLFIICVSTQVTPLPRGFPWLADIAPTTSLMSFSTKFYWNSFLCLSITIACAHTHRSRKMPIFLQYIDFNQNYMYIILHIKEFYKNNTTYTYALYSHSM